MARPEPVNDLDPRLRDHREPIIEFICRPCDRHCTLERKLLVKAFGASVSFAVLRRRMAMGCERMQTPRVTSAARTSHVWPRDLMEARR